MTCIHFENIKNIRSKRSPQTRFWQNGFSNGFYDNTVNYCDGNIGPINNNYSNRLKRNHIALYGLKNRIVPQRKYRMWGDTERNHRTIGYSLFARYTYDTAFALGVIRIFWEHAMALLVFCAKTIVSTVFSIWKRKMFLKPTKMSLRWDRISNVVACC